MELGLIYTVSNTVSNRSGNRAATPMNSSIEGRGTQLKELDRPSKASP
jgi:hypothetical protein